MGAWHRGCVSTSSALRSKTQTATLQPISFAESPRMAWSAILQPCPIPRSLHRNHLQRRGIRSQRRRGIFQPKQLATPASPTLRLVALPRSLAEKRRKVADRITASIVFASESVRNEVASPARIAPEHCFKENCVRFGRSSQSSGADFHSQRELQKQSLIHFCASSTQLTECKSRSE